MICISVPFKENLKDLKEDLFFLNYVIEQLVDKLELSSRMELEIKALEERVLQVESGESYTSLNCFSSESRVKLFLDILYSPFETETSD